MYFEEDNAQTDKDNKGCQLSFGTASITVFTKSSLNKIDSHFGIEIEAEISRAAFLERVFLIRMPT